MKKVYWHPGTASWRIQVLLALCALAAMGLVETLKVRITQPHYREKLQAARSMQRGLAALRTARLATTVPIDRELDPAESGVIGLLASPITSTAGSLEAKRTTINPNWAAVLVELLTEAGVRPGSTVALACSGSFPALNLATIVAAETLGARVVAVTSLSSSTWGANLPDLTWLDMERLLADQHLIRARSVAASLGGPGDRGGGMGTEGRALLRAAIDRNQVPIIEGAEADQALDTRLALYHRHAGQSPIAVFVNVGGGTLSVGSAIGKRFFPPGLTRRPSPKALSIDSILSRFAREGVPVIHLRQINKLAAQYGLPLDPPTTPAVGTGPLFERLEYNLPLTAGCLAAIIALLALLIAMGKGYHIVGRGAVGTRERPGR